MTKPIECRYRNETAIDDYCDFNQCTPCRQVSENNCYALHIDELIVKCQNDVDELANALDDEFLKTLGNYLEVLRNGF